MRVLVVEDELKTGEYLRKGLSEQGFVVDVARTGDDGTHLALNEDYAVIVLDVMLPGADGWSVLKSLRSAKQTPVLFAGPYTGVAMSSFQVSLEASRPIRIRVSTA
jgi:DNA-binding response OmpR family regulator